MIHTAARLRAGNRRLNRINQGVEQALTAMAAGCSLHLEYGQGGPRWRLSDGTTIADGVARALIGRSHIVSVGDALFADVPAQTWRYCG